MNPEKLMEYLKASMPNITQEKPQAEDRFETKLQERTLQENIDLITKIGKKCKVLSLNIYLQS